MRVHATSDPLLAEHIVNLQGRAKKWSRGLVNFVSAVSHHCLNMPGAWVFLATSEPLLTEPTDSSLQSLSLFISPLLLFSGGGASPDQEGLLFVLLRAPFAGGALGAPAAPLRPPRRARAHAQGTPQIPTETQGRLYTRHGWMRWDHP